MQIKNYSIRDVIEIIYNNSNIFRFIFVESNCKIAPNYYIRMEKVGCASGEIDWEPCDLSKFEILKATLTKNNWEDVSKFYENKH